MCFFNLKHHFQILVYCSLTYSFNSCAQRAPTMCQNSALYYYSLQPSSRTCLCFNVSGLKLAISGKIFHKAIEQPCFGVLTNTQKSSVYLLLSCCHSVIMPAFSICVWVMVDRSKCTLLWTNVCMNNT